MASGVGSGMGMLGNEGRHGEDRASAMRGHMQGMEATPSAARPPGPMPNMDPAQTPFSLVGYPPQLVLPVLLPNGSFRIAVLVPKLPLNDKDLTERQKKSIRFREKRAVQRFLPRHQPDVDADRSRRAKAQPRGEHGFFISESVALERRVAELRNKLNQSESEALALRARLSTAEQELHRIQLIASPEQSSAHTIDGTQSAASPSPAATLELGATAAPTTPRQLPPPSSVSEAPPFSSPLAATPSTAALGSLLLVPASPFPSASTAVATPSSSVAPTPPQANGRKRRAAGEA